MKQLVDCVKRHRKSMETMLDNYVFQATKVLDEYLTKRPIYATFSYFAVPIFKIDFETLTVDVGGPDSVWEFQYSEDLQEYHENEFKNPHYAESYKNFSQEERDFLTYLDQYFDVYLSSGIDEDRAEDIIYPFFKV